MRLAISKARWSGSALIQNAVGIEIASVITSSRNARSERSAKA